MGAIIGILRLDGAGVTKQDLLAMTARAPLRFEGPVGLWTQGPVGFGRSGGAAVTRHPESGMALVLDGEVHEWRGARSPQISSPELEADVLEDYARRGRGALEALTGDFGLAIWDASRARLVLGRDAIGVRPLYVGSGPKVLAFSTDLRCLLAVEGVSSEIDESGVLHLFYPELLFVDRTSTSYRDIKRLPSATHIVVEADGSSSAQHHQYWHLDPEREIQFGSDEEYGEAFLESFREAVACRLPARGSVGTTLSGGLDSASVTCVARSALAGSGRGPVHVFSVAFPDFPDVDESNFQKAVIEQGGLEAHRITPDRESPLVDFDEALDTIAEPFYGPNYYLPWRICKSAQAVGVTAVLDGTDGDVTVGHGIDQLVGLAERARWREFVAEAKSITARYSHPTYATEDGILDAHGLPSLERHARAGRLVAFVKGVHTLGLGFNRSRLSLIRRQGLGALGRRPKPRRGSELDPDFVARLDLDDRFEEFEHQRQLKPGPRASHFRDLSSGALPSVLEHLDRIASASGLEMRHPFADRRLIELCLALPPEQKLRNGWGRWVLRQGMAGLLPEEVRWRGDKAAISPVFLRGLEQHEAQRARRVADSERLEGYVDRKTLKSAIHRFLNGDRRVRDGPLIWRAIVLDSWLRSRT